MLLNALHLEALSREPRSLVSVLSAASLEQIARWLGEESALGRTPIQQAHAAWMESRAAQQLQRKAPTSERLLRRSDGKEVEAPPLAPGRWHLFLSHTWAGGCQDMMRLVKTRLLQLVASLRVWLDVDGAIATLDPVPAKTAHARLNAHAPIHALSAKRTPSRSRSLHRGVRVLQT